MLQVTAHMKIYVATEPLDFRRGIDGTAATCRLVLQREPLSGAVFVFRNRTRTMVRVLVFDGHGTWLVTKRVSRGRFAYWSRCDDADTAIDPHQLYTLLAGGDWTKMAPVDNWRSIQKARAA